MIPRRRLALAAVLAAALHDRELRPAHGGQLTERLVTGTLRHDPGFGGEPGQGHGVHCGRSAYGGDHAPGLDGKELRQARLQLGRELRALERHLGLGQHVPGS